MMKLVKKTFDTVLGLCLEGVQVAEASDQDVLDAYAQIPKDVRDLDATMRAAKEAGKIVADEIFREDGVVRFGVDHAKGVLHNAWNGRDVDVAAVKEAVEKRHEKAIKAFQKSLAERWDVDPKNLGPREYKQAVVREEVRADRAEEEVARKDERIQELEMRVCALQTELARERRAHNDARAVAFRAATAANLPVVPGDDLGVVNMPGLGAAPMINTLFLHAPTNPRAAQTMSVVAIRLKAIKIQLPCGIILRWVVPDEESLK